MPRAISPRRLTLALLAGAVLQAGCGYTVSSVLPTHIKTIAIPTFANNTVENGLAGDVTESLINGFLTDKRLRLERERDADSILRGTILAYRSRVYAYTSQEVATQYEILLVAQVAFRDVQKNRDIWKEDELTVRTTYNVVAVGSEPAKTEADGRKDVIQKMTDLIVSRTVQGW